MANAASEPVEEKKRPKQGRSPAYPGLNIKDALAKAKALNDAEGQYAAPMPSAFAAWGYGSKSSGGRETRAALKYYGLITVEGDNETGKVKLTEKALRVLLDEREDQSEKQALIREFALTPAIHKELFNEFPNGLKSDPTVAHYLVFEQGYNKAAAAELVAEFKATADYAGLYKPAITVVNSGNVSENPPFVLDIGDLVQVEIGGAFQLEKPKRVRAIQDDQGQKWVFIEGSETGIPMDQVRLEQKGTVLPAGAVVPPRLAEDKLLHGPGMKEEKNSLDEGEAVLIWPETLSADSVRDLEYWLKGILQKAKRRAGLKDDEGVN